MLISKSVKDNALGSLAIGSMGVTFIIRRLYRRLCETASYGTRLLKQTQFQVSPKSTDRSTGLNWVAHTMKKLSRTLANQSALCAFGDKSK